MSAVFGREYAEAYDLFNTKKDYVGECDLVVDAIKEHLGTATNVLDLGCGTGGHAIPLATRGYNVTGVDVSPEMLDLARRKAKEQSVDVTWIEAEIGSLTLGSQFDIVLMLYAVLGYAATIHDARAMLGAARRHLRPGGLLILDVWHSPAVLREGPTPRVRIATDAAGRTIIRSSEPKLRSLLNIVAVSTRVWVIEGDRLIGAAHEEHAVRYFSCPELELLLDLEDLSVVHFFDFPRLRTKPSEFSWEVGCIAHNRVP